MEGERRRAPFFKDELQSFHLMRLYGSSSHHEHVTSYLRRQGSGMMNSLTRTTFIEPPGRFYFWERVSEKQGLKKVLKSLLV